MSEVTIKIEGMSCGGCVRSVTGALKALPGVEDAQVLLDAAEARVSFDPAKVTVDAMRTAVENAGFDSPA